MSVLDGPRKELRHVVHGGSAYWATYENGELRLDDGRLIAERDVTYLPPCNPTKIICIHLNYMSRLYEFTGANKPPANATYFQKPVTAINSHNGELVRPEGYQYLNYEGEVAAIIGKVTRNIAPDQVWDHLAGFAPGNDVGLQDMRDTDGGSMLRVKGLTVSVRSAPASCPASTSASRRCAPIATASWRRKATSPTCCSRSTTSSPIWRATSRWCRA